jgi:hypothetical protein
MRRVDECVLFFDVFLGHVVPSERPITSDHEIFGRDSKIGARVRRRLQYRESDPAKAL